MKHEIKEAALITISAQILILVLSLFFLSGCASGSIFFQELGKNMQKPREAGQPAYSQPVQYQRQPINCTSNRIGQSVYTTCN